MLFKWQKRGIDKQICQLRLCAVVWQTVFEDATCFWNCHLAHTHIHNVCIWELLSLIVFVFIFIVMHNGLSCQCVSVVPAGSATFGEAVRRHKPAPCNQLYFYFLYFVLWFIYLVNACVRCTLYLFDYLLCFFYLQAVCICIHSKSEKVSGTAFSVEKNCRKSA